MRDPRQGQPRSSPLHAPPKPRTTFAPARRRSGYTAGSVAPLLLLLLAGCVTSGWDRPYSDPTPTQVERTPDDGPIVLDDDTTADDDTAADDDSQGDDDTASDDDTSPDDDTVSDDDSNLDDDTSDDDSVDDDDSGSDDDTQGDDDTTGLPAFIVVEAPTTSFGSVLPGQEARLPVTVRNTGGALAAVSLFLTASSGGVYTIDPAVPTFVVTGGGASSYEVVFSPIAEQSYATVLRVTHDGSNPSPIELSFSGAGGTTEGSCTDGLDGDGDSDIDCADGDCTADPACTGLDPCCFPGDTSTFSACFDSPASTCTCAADTFCCDVGGGWDSNCVGIYTVTCGALCPP